MQLTFALIGLAALALLLAPSVAAEWERRR